MAGRAGRAARAFLRRSTRRTGQLHHQRGSHANRDTSSFPESERTPQLAPEPVRAADACVPAKARPRAQGPRKEETLGLSGGSAMPGWEFPQLSSESSAEGGHGARDVHSRPRQEPPDPRSRSHASSASRRHVWRGCVVDASRAQVSARHPWVGSRAARVARCFDSRPHATEPREEMTSLLILNAFVLTGVVVVIVSMFASANMADRVPMLLRGSRGAPRAGPIHRSGGDVFLLASARCGARCSARRTGMTGRTGQG